MISLITFIFLVIMTMLLAGIFVSRKDIGWVSCIMLAGWVFMFLILNIIHLWSPFTIGPDDKFYFDIAARPVTSFSEFFDLREIAKRAEQPGYPWLLSCFNFFVGHDLMSFKLFNLAAYIMLIPVWFRIGIELDSEKFARYIAVVILFLTPLWYYFFFLLKDMIIIFLQSLFISGLVMIHKKVNLLGIFILFFSTMILILLRSQLVLVNIMIVGTIAFLMSFYHAREKKYYKRLFILVLLIGSIYYLASNERVMWNLGIVSKQRILGNSEMLELPDKLSEASSMKKNLFPLLYFLRETSGLNVVSFASFDSYRLRGVLKLPWIIFGVPFFFLGFMFLLTKNQHSVNRDHIPVNFNIPAAINSPWISILIFLFFYLVLAWEVGDTTRYRIPDLPAMSAVTTFGWLHSSRRLRYQVLVSWILIGGALAAVFYLVQML